MNIIKIFYIFNYLLVVNFLTPHLCNNNFNFLKNLNSNVEVHSKSKEKKRKKLILFSFIATALAVSIASSLGIHFYLWKKRKGKPLSDLQYDISESKREIPPSVWDNKHLGKVAVDVLDEAIERGELDVKKALQEGILDENLACPSLESIKKYIREGAEDRFLKLTKSQMEEIENMAHYCLYNIKFISLPKQIRELSMVPEPE
ncbi:early transcribed membrane protein [Plasmodium gallinaceum]|uniref:Early transcribed membrane protein n=1 Tax=Plasmodium gallinaceum TaxID=5849 RepID=A0A1J1GSY3_PLAGA|nr:early transcribed membrane protein [Plasmodium gallinaceum]CRG94416.1 early transcribed membrane protein [Plasmodium gallinaceum]